MCPLVVHCLVDLQSVHGFRCHDNTAPNAKCQRVLVLALCLVVAFVSRVFMNGPLLSMLDGPWNRSDPTPEAAESGQNWTYIGDLTPGEEYFFRVVAVNGLEPNTRETRSDPPWKEVIYAHC